MPETRGRKCKPIPTAPAKPDDSASDSEKKQYTTDLARYNKLMYHRTYYQKRKTKALATKETEKELLDRKLQYLIDVNERLMNLLVSRDQDHK